MWNEVVNAVIQIRMSSLMRNASDKTEFIDAGSSNRMKFMQVYCRVMNPSLLHKSKIFARYSNEIDGFEFSQNEFEKILFRQSRDKN